MNRTSWFFALSAPLLLAATAGHLSGQAQMGPAPVTATFDSPRPVSAAAHRLEVIYGWPITYEEPAYRYMAGLDFKNAEMRGGAPRPEPVRRSFSMTLPERTLVHDGERPSEDVTRAAIESMLRSYFGALTGGVETFTVTQSNGMFHVVPTRGQDEAGNWVEVRPILDSPVDVPMALRTRGEFIRSICSAVEEKTGEKITLVLMASNGDYPSNWGTSAGETARSALSRVTQAWDMEYRPGWGYWFLRRSAGGLSK